MAKKENNEEEEKKLTDVPGIGPGIATKLEAAGVYDLMGLAVLSPASLSEMAGIGEAVARKAIQAARGMMNLGFVDGIEFAKKRENVCFITTGSANLDNLLGGKGIETRAITEAYGAFGSGKCLSKDTIVSYFNDTRLHVESIGKIYEKYKKEGMEKKIEEGFSIPLTSVKVLAWKDGQINIVKASDMYKEKVQKILVIRTKKGRILKITGKHQLLSFQEGVKWKKAGLLQKGDLIAYPKKIELMSEENIYEEDDAYFLGLFLAEGKAEPFSILAKSESIKNWICNYINRKFGYAPNIEEEDDGTYTIFLKRKDKSFMRGLDRCKIEERYIPEEIFVSNEKIILSFLAGYFKRKAEFKENSFLITIKSSKLTTQLTYLLLRAGISSHVEKKILNSTEFNVIRIFTKEKSKFFNNEFRFEDFEYTKKEDIDYPKKLVFFIENLCKESINELKRFLRKYALEHLPLEGIKNKSLKEFFDKKNSLERLNLFFNALSNQKETIKNIINRLENEKSSFGLLKKVDYKRKDISRETSKELKESIKSKLEKRARTIENILKMISEASYFNWDVVESIDIEDYNDYVYDFIVPEGHSFLGGNMPTMMHNSQLGFTLSVNAQLPKDQGGAEGKTVFIDTEGTFRPERIRQIAKGLGANPENVLKNILVARAFNSDHQILLIDKIGEMIKGGELIKLAVIDSLTAHFRAEFTGRGQLADRQQKLNRYLHNLMRMAEQHNLAVFVTNQVMANPGMMFGDPTTAIGGNVLGHASTYRLYLRRGKSGSRVAKLIDSPNLPDNECQFFITEHGIRDKDI